jgi:hypothetical protein
MLHEEQQLHSTSGLSGGLQSATKVPRNPGGLVLLRLAQISSGITPVKSLLLKKAIPVFHVCNIALLAVTKVGYAAP